MKGSYSPSNRLVFGTHRMHDPTDLVVPESIPVTVYRLVIVSPRVTQLGAYRTLSYHTIPFCRRQHNLNHSIGLFLSLPQLPDCLHLGLTLYLTILDRKRSTAANTTATLYHSLLSHKHLYHNIHFIFPQPQCIWTEETAIWASPSPQP